MGVFRKFRECILRAQARSTMKKFQIWAEQQKKAEEEKRLVREKSYLYE
jgi:hypothetical protein